MVRVVSQVASSASSVGKAGTEWRSIEVDGNGTEGIA
jgi:hypothetical protein